MFASKSPSDLNHDKFPFVLPDGSRDSHSHQFKLVPGQFGWTVARNREYAGAKYDPRPEFDHVQHNEPNPILAYFREFLGGRIGEDFKQEAVSLIESLEDSVGYPPEQIHHALLVLERLARLAKKGS